MGAEQERLDDASDARAPWRKWGPYLSERQWGTVREDYSADGNAWEHFPHDHARSRAYRWGEDGLAGISDDRQRLCFALALWNGEDPILKERLFGLANGEGNHGEDVKEYYYYLDSTPTHSYMKYLYKYPQAAFPYDDLVATSAKRGRREPEYELIDTGVFREDRYFDVFVEYAKASPEDLLVSITVHNRGPQAASVSLLPTLWFRNEWSWREDIPRPELRTRYCAGAALIESQHWKLGKRYLWCEGAPLLLFTENETNTERVLSVPNQAPYVKDGINDFVVHGKLDAVNPAQVGTKLAAVYSLTIPSGQSIVVRLRMSEKLPQDDGAFGASFDEMMTLRRREADEFYAELTPPSLTPDEATVMRQALGGMLWSKQFYFYDVNRWLGERRGGAVPGRQPEAPRNGQWHHMYNADVISMPDKWEYPWYAAWDLAFHAIPLALVDLKLAKHQLDLMLEEHYLHPSGQIPAYEWNFGDVNPPVHAWATIFTYRLEKGSTGKGDVRWLAKCFQKLLLNFTWWVNRKDRVGNNVFEGGFLGLDNIGVFDRSAKLPTGGCLEQADGTAWMALFCQNMLEIAFELSLHDPAYEPMTLKFLEHFHWIASSMVHLGENTGMWDEEDGFFYDVLRYPDGEATRLKVRSMVGLLPLCAATLFLPADLGHVSQAILDRYRWFMESRPELVAHVHDPRKRGSRGQHLISILDEDKLRRVLARMLDENEFLSPYGIRSVSRFHAEHPYTFHLGGEEFRVGYLPAESDSGMFGGNSNWRGPIWMPVNVLIIRALLSYDAFYGENFTVECPTGSGNRMTLFEVAREISQRLGRIFLRGPEGRRPVFGDAPKFQDDPHWRDHVLFYEYFHGDNGAGLGASHQTGWTGCIARLLHLFGTLSPDRARAEFREAFFGGHNEVKAEQADRPPLIAG